MRTRRVFSVLILAGLLSAVGYAQDDELEEVYHARGVAMGRGMAGTLTIHITRWTTAEERKALIECLVENGQEKTVELLRKQKETGWVRTQSGAGMRGWPSVRLHYAYEFKHPDGKRSLVLVTDRNIGTVETMQNTRSTDYTISGILMDFEKGEDGKEKGQGTLLQAVELGVDKEKKQISIEHLGTEPVRLTTITREK